MKNHIAVLESEFSLLSMMGSELDESIRVVIFLSSLSERSEFVAIVASVATLQQQLATWNYVSNVVHGRTKIGSSEVK